MNLVASNIIKQINIIDIIKDNTQGSFFFDTIIPNINQIGLITNNNITKMKQNSPNKLPPRKDKDKAIYGIMKAPCQGLLFMQLKNLFFLSVFFTQKSNLIIAVIIPIIIK